MIKKISALLLVVAFVFLFSFNLYAQEKNVNLYLFYSNSCPHCHDELDFLDSISGDYPDLRINKYELSDKDNVLLFQKIGKELEIEVGAVPMTFIGEEYLVGFFNGDTTGKEILNIYEELKASGDPNIVGRIIGETKDDDDKDKKSEGVRKSQEIKNPVNIPEELNFPVLGSIKTESLSLPLLTFFIALMDGFNPCAMWVLLFLISILLGMKDRRKMWILGSVFILTSGLIYFLFLSAWLNVFLFLGYVFWVRILIGIVAVSAGIYQLKDYWTNRQGGCKTADGEKRRKIFDKIREITDRKEIVYAIFGIVLLACAVNVVELVCSAGLPAVYTQVLSLSKLDIWQYYLYLLFYIFVFILDDLFVFIVAMATLHMTGIQSKYSRFSRLFGGIIIFILGLLLIFKPELLMFS